MDESTRRRDDTNAAAGRLWRVAAVAGCVTASAGVLVAPLLPPPLAAWVMAMAAALAPAALIGLGVWRRDGRHRRLAWPVLGLLLWLALVLGSLVAVAGGGAIGLVGGLPLATALAVWGLWLVPLAPICLAFALTFDGSFLLPEDVDRLARLDRRRAGGG